MKSRMNVFINTTSYVLDIRLIEMVSYGLLDDGQEVAVKILLNFCSRGQ